MHGSQHICRNKISAAQTMQSPCTAINYMQGMQLKMGRDTNLHSCSWVGSSQIVDLGSLCNKQSNLALQQLHNKVAGRYVCFTIRWQGDMSAINQFWISTSPEGTHATSPISFHDQKLVRRLCTGQGREGHNQMIKSR